MTLDVNHLFKVMLEAEERRDTELASHVKSLIKDSLEGTLENRESVATKFVEMIKGKKVHDVQKELLSRDMNEIQLTTQVASMISWSLQAVERLTPLAYSYLGIPEQVNLLSRMVEGGVSQDEVISFYKKTIPEVWT